MVRIMWAKYLLLSFSFITFVPFVHAKEAPLADLDKAALLEFRQIVSKQMKIDQEFALEKALASLMKFPAEVIETEFSPLKIDDSSDFSCKWPNEIPNGINLDEWEAIVRSSTLARGEGGCANYTLLDMDGDGKRDLLVNVYEGGTGLFNYFSMMQRVGNKFVGVPNSIENEIRPETAGSGNQILGYSTNGRGSNQSVYWIYLNNRVYIAYVNSHYGEDTVYLLRPFAKTVQVPILRVSYHYSFRVPQKQVIRIHDNNGRDINQTTTISLDFQRTLEEAIRKSISPYVSQDSGVVDLPCPAPAGTAEDDRSLYSYFGPGHYTIEIVGSFSFWWEKQCHLAQIINWFGRYLDKEGLIATLTVRKPPHTGDAEYQVDVKRKLIGLKNGQGIFEQ